MVLLLTFWKVCFSHILESVFNIAESTVVLESADVYPSVLALFPFSD